MAWMMRLSWLLFLGLGLPDSGVRLSASSSGAGNRGPDPRREAGAPGPAESRRVRVQAGTIRLPESPGRFRPGLERSIPDHARFGLSTLLPSLPRPAGFPNSTSSSSTSGRRAARTFLPAWRRPTVHTRLRPGDVLHLSDPTGTLYLGQDSDRPILVVAGGSGAAPFVGLLEYWFEAGMNRTRKIHFFFGVRSRRDLLLHDKFSSWAVEKENFTYTRGPLLTPRGGRLARRDRLYSALRREVRGGPVRSGSLSGRASHHG